MTDETIAGVAIFTGLATAMSMLAMATFFLLLSLSWLTRKWPADAPEVANQRKLSA